MTSIDMVLNSNYEDGFKDGYSKGVDVFFQALNRNNIIRNENDLIIASIIAENLIKAGVKDEMPTM